MKTRLLALAVCGLMLPQTTAEEKPKEEKKDAAVREIDVKGLKLPIARDGDVNKPTTITSAEELAKAVPDEEAQAKIKKEVDFGKQKILLFSWAGSGGDKLSFATVEGKNEIVFTIKRGLTRDLRPHVHLFVLPKDAAWKVGAQF
jgi:hypothetical protein